MGEEEREEKGIGMVHESAELEHDGVLVPFYASAAVRAVLDFFPLRTSSCRRNKERIVRFTWLSISLSACFFCPSVHLRPSLFLNFSSNLYFYPLLSVSLVSSFT